MTAQTNIPRSVAERMQHDIDNARKSYSRAKDGIIEAIAYASRVYRATEEHRNAAARIEDEIETRNSKFDDYNKQQHDDRERAVKLAANKLADKDLDKDERDRLKALAKLSDDVWKVRHVKLKIETRTDENACRRIIKHVFGLDCRADAPNVSRYETAVLWVHEHCRQDASATEIFNAIKGAGGLDKVIELQRTANKQAEGPGIHDRADADEDDAGTPTTKSQPSKIRASMKAAKPVKSIAMKLNAQADDLILLVGRYNKGKVGILRTAPLSDDVLESIAHLFAAAPAAGGGKKAKSSRRI